MSGEGALPYRGPYPIATHRSLAEVDEERAEARATERADTIAWLERKRRNAALLAARSDFADEGRTAARILGVIIDDLKNGLHEGESPGGPTAPATAGGGFEDRGRER